VLKAHLDVVEENLLQIAKTPANSGHSLHKGTPREAFIKEFLVDHLSERVAIGTGEIIDANSKPGEQRNQIDIVIYKRDYPRIHFGGGIKGFLAESVVATIEVKSSLTKDELRDTMKAARVLKGLQRNVVTSFTAGYQPPSILSYVVAYDGPVSMSTVLGWIPVIHRELEIRDPEMRLTLEERIKVASPSLDGIFVLGKGFLQFDNSPFSFQRDEARAQNPKMRWNGADIPVSNLLVLFLCLTQAVSGVSGSRLDPGPYMDSFVIDDQKMVAL
jgi:hypothetical protein